MQLNSYGNRSRGGHWLAAFLFCGLAAGAFPAIAASAGTSKPSTTHKLHGAPVTVGLMTPVNNSIESIPDGPKMAELASRAINAEGGIKGHPLKVIFCDTLENANQASLCATQLLVTDKVRMLVGDNEVINASAVWPEIDQVGAADFGGTAALGGPAAVDPHEFGILPGSTAVTYTGLAAAIPTSIKTVAVFHSTTSGATAAANAAEAVMPPHVKYFDVPIVLGTTNWGPTCTQIQADGVQGVFSLSSPTSVAPLFAQCIQQGIRAKWFFADSQLSPGLVHQVSVTNTPNEISVVYNAASLKLLKSDLKKYGKGLGLSVEGDSYSLQFLVWFGVRNSVYALTHGPTTQTGMFAWLNRQKAYPLINGTTVNFTKQSLLLPGAPRVFNTSVSLASIGKHGSVTLLK